MPIANAKPNTHIPSPTTSPTKSGAKSAVISSTPPGTAERREGCNTILYTSVGRRPRTTAPIKFLFPFPPFFPGQKRGFCLGTERQGIRPFLIRCTGGWKIPRRCDAPCAQHWCQRLASSLLSRPRVRRQEVCQSLLRTVNVCGVGGPGLSTALYFRVYAKPILECGSRAPA